MAVAWKEILKGAFSTGTSEGTGSNQQISHGLGASPNIVSIVPTESGATVSGLYVDSTNINVTVTSGKDFGWFAGVV
jgi:hypothetical protein